MILVTGATGSTGRHLVAQLKAQGAPVRALVRDAAKGEALGVEYAVGDFDDPASLAAAMDGVDRMFLASPGAQLVLEDGEQPMVRWERNAIDAAKGAGVRYVVKLSVLNARIGGRMSEGGHGEAEAHLKASGLEWTMLRPGGFMQNFLSPATVLWDEQGALIGPDGPGRMAFIDCHDIAACAAALFTDKPEPGGTLQITGPEAISYEWIAAQLSRGWGRPVGFHPHSEEAVAARLLGFGLAPQQAAELASLYGSMGSGSFQEVTGEVERLTGRRPRTFAEFMAANPEDFPGLR
ncbi:SDR family oxidoreductase [Glycomyces sp. MUSA5-2]|uniref:SDR family oxidoreductase n=1 Tax=Glycomyces sp. MUSA5-2 TaxID=2053002 RepID=UPI0030088FD9